MDTLSHALWGKGLFGYTGYSKLAIFFGAMPDLFSFGLLIIIRLFQGDYNYSGPPSLDSNACMALSYNFRFSISFKRIFSHKNYLAYV